MVNSTQEMQKIQVVSGGFSSNRHNILKTHKDRKTLALRKEKTWLTGSFTSPFQEVGRHAPPHADFACSPCSTFDFIIRR
jgi:hypothetical protein